MADKWRRTPMMDAVVAGGMSVKLEDLCSSGKPHKSGYVTRVVRQASFAAKNPIFSFVRTKPDRFRLEVNTARLRNLPNEIHAYLDHRRLARDMQTFL